MTLAQEYFRAIEETNRLEEMLSEKIEELIGATEADYIRFLPFDDAVVIECAANSLAVTPDSQQKIFALGFKRIFLNHQNGMETYYYTGGDVRGYHKLRER